MRKPEYIGGDVSPLSPPLTAPLIGRTEIEIRKLFIELEETALKLGLRINDQKTEYMIMKRNIHVNENRSPLIIDKYTFERGELFKFLGVMINEQNQREVEIKVRIQNANKVYYSLQFLLGSKFLTRNTKLKIYNTVIRPVLSYGSESWSLTKKEEHHLQVFENNVYRKMFGPYFDPILQAWRKRSNKELHTLSQQAPILNVINSRRLQWAGHLLRMGNDRMVLRTFKEDLVGQRPVGRPRSTWKNEIFKLCRRLNVDNWQELAQNRVQWRQFVRSARDLRVP